MNRTVPALVALALAAAAPRAASAATRVELVRPEPGGAAAWAAASLAASRRATISTRLSASVTSVHVVEGMRVRAGQLLLRLSDDDLRAGLAAAETARAAAAAHEKRIANLAAERAATRSELEAAQAQRAQADAAVAAARASLAYAEIRAPFDATVQARRVNAGDLVGPGQPLVDLEGAGLEVQATLSEDEARSLHIGQRLRFQSGDRRGEAEIVALAPGGDPLSHRRGLRARVVAGGEGLSSGSFARLELTGATPRAGAWVPRSALVERGDLTGVVVARAGRAELRWVATGEPLGDRVPIRAGLAAGEPVIDAPGALRDGEAVEVSRGE